MVKRLVAHELTLSFVPDVTQRLWRTVTRRKYQLTRNRVQLQNRLESLLEEAHIKVSTLVSDLLGASARRMLRAVATGETDPAAVAALGSPRLHATPEQLCDALGASTDVHPLYRRLLAMTLAELDVLEAHMQQLDEELAALLRVHQDAVQRLAAVPGLGCRFGAADHRGSRPHGDDVSNGQAPGVLGGRLSRARGERRHQPQSPRRRTATGRCVACSIKRRTRR